MTFRFTSCRLDIALFAFVSFQIASALPAQPTNQAYMVIDRRTQSVSNAASEPAGFCQAGPITYFAAESVGGRELWRTDGTSNGTFLIKDINPNGSSDPRDLIIIGNILYFSAITDLGRELWKSDGTAFGTEMVADLAPGSQSSILAPTLNEPDESRSGDFTLFNGSLYFKAAVQSDFGDPIPLLFKSNGTPETTIQVTSTPDPFSPFGSTLQEIEGSDDCVYFTVRSATYEGDVELWKTNGTEAGTVRIPLPEPFTSPGHLTDVNGTLFFSARQNTIESSSLLDRELLKTDGTGPGTLLVTDIVPGTSGAALNNFAQFGDKIVFSADLPSTGREPWVSDGTPAGTILLKDINTSIDINGNGYGSYPVNFTASNGLLYFAADNQLSSGNALNNREFLTARDVYVSDGTPAGTRLVLDLNNNSDDVVPEQFTSYNGHTYFIAENTVSPHGPVISEITIYKSDGTIPGTQRMANNFHYNSSDIRGLFARPDMLLSSGNRYTGTGPLNGLSHSELWQSLGTDASTNLLKDLHQQFLSSSPDSGQALANKLFFSDLSTTTRYISYSDGTAPGTQYTGLFGRPVGVVNNRLLHLSRAAGPSGPTGETNLYSSDSNAGNTLLIDDNDYSDDPEFAMFGFSALYIGESDINSDESLWKTDGTPGGTVLLKEDFRMSRLRTISPNLALFIGGDSFEDGYQVWKTDGTPEGTAMVIELAGSTNLQIYEITAIDGKGYFFTNKVPEDYEGTDDFLKLYSTDGTAEGTHLLVDDLIDSSSNPGINVLGTLPGKLFFTFGDSDDSPPMGREPWVFNVATSTASVLKDIYPGEAGSLQPVSFSSPYPAISHAGLFYFMANDGVHGNELWSTDGTPTGTQMVADINTGFGSGSPNNLSSIGDALVFTATDRILGNELFIIDVPGAEPRLLQDINPGPYPSLASEFTWVSGMNLLFFAATTNTAGRELWTISGAALGPPPTAATGWELYE